ncbi:hypothetical protein [Seonamhaeicola sp. S2-3]|uniref:hypothetical protein n=1 Tax=Seonamhaeicola sp. S2-3 TaxID=1936081 RepID=UPI0012FBBA8A|nr:hypothetical protein [Seonamhaeicola sp. S2-3]
MIMKLEYLNYEESIAINGGNNIEAGKAVGEVAGKVVGVILGTIVTALHILTHEMRP